MSKFNLNKNVLAVALLATLVPGIASAATVVVGAAKNHAYEVTNLSVSPNPTAAVNTTFSYDLQAGDILIGRTAGNISVRVTLTGANYSATPPTVVPVQGSMVSAPIVSGNVLSFVMSPPVSPGFVASALFTITAPTLTTELATALATLGGNVTAAVDVRDTGTNLTLQTAVSGTVLTSTQASLTSLAAATTTTASVASGKKNFIAGGGFVDANNLTLGVVTANPNTNGGNPAMAAGAGPTFADNVASGLTFQFDATGTPSVTQSQLDRVDVQVNFTDTTGFTQVTLGTATCAGGTGTLVNNAGVLAVLTKTLNQYAGAIDVSGVGSQTLYICGRVDGTGVIKNQAVTASARIDYLVARDTLFNTAATISNIVYNGISQDVDFFNPSTNVNQQSFLRVSNSSTTAGLVTITGVCDNGAATSGTATFNLGAGVSVLLTSQALASGAGLSTPLGTCPVAGKLRLNVTGEFGSMKVQNFIKTALSSGEVTTNANREN